MTLNIDPVSRHLRNVQTLSLPISNKTKLGGGGGMKAEQVEMGAVI